MIWVLLAPLGVPIWLVAGGLVAALWNRRRVRRTPDAFPCRFRSLSGEDGSGNWIRGTACGRWVHDVLLLNHGLALARSTALQVRDIQGAVSRPVGVKLRGGAAVSIQLSLDDASTVEVAAPESFAHLLSGPFLAFEAKRVEEASS
jgi:hypothetical protein